MPLSAEHRFTSSAIGDLVGGYRIGARLGAGGAGAVFAATRDGDAGPFAVKLMLPLWAGDAVMVERFRREIATLTALTHPNVVRILDYGQEPDGRLWYAMPRLRGTDLDKLLQARGRLAVDDAIAIMDAVCAALEAAHAHSVIHRDLKASNVFIGDEDPPTITLLDFGAARVDTSTRGQGLTAAGTAVGTPTSMAPEQVVGLDPDARTDVYAAGVLLFRMLVGRHPFERGTPEEIMLDQLSKPPPRPSDLAAVPPALERVVLRCLEKSADERYASATALRAALRETRPTTATQRPAAPVLAVHVELAASEAILGEFGLDALERSAELLAEADYELVLGVGGSVLGIAPLGTDPARSIAAAARLAEALCHELLHEFDRELAPRIVVHVRDASLDRELGDADDCRDATLAAGVHLSRAARDLLAASG